MGQSVIRKLLKNIAIYAVLFVALSAAVDWYRKPSVPAQFAQQAFVDLNDQPKLIAQLSHQQPMVLYFWGSWCHFCQFTSPAVQSLVEDGVPVLTIALRSGDEKAVKNYLAENGYQFSTINDPNGDISNQWGIQATPTILIIKDGKIFNHTTGLTSYWGLKTRLKLATLF